MYYYAYIDSNYKVTGVYALPTEMTANGYIAITEEQYNSGNLVNKYYNPITGSFDEAHGWVCNASEIQYKSGNVTLDEKLDAMDGAIEGKADENHTHTGYAAAEHTHTGFVTETTYTAGMNGKANVSHTHTDYADINHTHTGFASSADVEALQTAVDGKAASNHTHSNYAAVNHTHSDYASIADVETVEAAIAGKANTSHTHAQDDINGLATTLSSKANTSHTHAQSEVTGLSTALDGKVDKVDGKALSTNDYTTAEKTKLAGIATGANAYTHPTSHPASMITGLSTVATSGNYNDLSNKPTSMTPTAHTHGIEDITTLANQLANKAALNSVEILEVGTDLNSYTTAGMYSFSVSSAPLNMPNGCTNGWLIVIPWSAGSNTIKQFFLRHGTPNSTDHFTYTRMYTLSGGWSDWTTYYTTSNPPTAAEVGAISKDLLFTNSLGGVEYSYSTGSGKNVLTEISNMPQGFHTIYAIAGTTGNPETTESYRYFIHKTSSTIGWIYAFGADGSIYSNYQSAASTYKGWRTIHDVKRKPLWTGSYYMTAGHTVTPSKKLSECEHGWILLWSDYDPDTSTVNNTDFCTTMIPNRNWTGGTWNGAAYYCDCPRYTAGTATDSESRIIKVLNVYDNKLVGTANNAAAPRNDVILRAVYEF